MEQRTQQEPKKIQIWLPLLLSIMLVGGMLIGVKLKPAPPQTKIIIENDLASSYIGQGRIEELIRYIEAKYVDKVNTDDMVEKAINSLVKELDPHSSYISAEEVGEIQEQLDGNFKGIGVEFMMLDDTIVVIKPTPDGPSEKAGILSDDRIVMIGDSTVAGTKTKIKSIMKMLRGEEGSKVELGIQRKGESDLRPISIKRGRIPVYSVDVALMLEEEIGYIKVNRFSATTYNEFMKGVEKLVEKGAMKHLVIDLRQNPGGYLQEATKMLSQLFPEKDKLLVYTEGRAVHRNDYETTGQNFFRVENMVVLIDEGSASASEILAGAIQDWDRGLVIGRRSFGKGLVQEQYQLKNGSALRLTVARYYTPSGRSIQRPYEDQEVYDNEIKKRQKNGELWDENKMALNRIDTTTYFTSQGRKVYGGGGIIPDVFVPIDTTTINSYSSKLREHIPAFVYRYLEKHRSDFQDNLADFAKDYKVDEALLQELRSYADDKKIDYNATKFEASKSYLQELIKARIGKQLYDDEGFYTVINKDDLMIKEALEALRKSNPLVIKQ